MDDEITKDVADEIIDEEQEETKEEIEEPMNERYANDDEIEMLRSIEKRFDAIDEKIDNMISMFVDSGAIVQESIDDVSEQERKNYEDDFINIDEMDLSL